LLQKYLNNALGWPPCLLTCSEIEVCILVVHKLLSKCFHSLVTNDDNQHISTVFNKRQLPNSTTLRSLYSLKSILREVQVPVNILFNLFDAYVLSVLNYNSDVCGFNNADSIGRVHKKFCKSVLNVKSSTNSFAIYGELGRFPLIIERLIQIVNYFLKLHQTKKESILYCVLIDQR